MYQLYSIVLLLFATLMSPVLAYRSVRYRKYVGTLRQRLGFMPPELCQPDAGAIWVHAVSVGEYLAARPLIAALRRRHPGRRVYVSTTTRAAQELARSHAADVDGVFYIPFDLRWCVRRTLQAVKPALLVVVETDLWPHLLRECRRRGVATAFVNARLSSRSYPRYRRVRVLFRHVLADIDRFCVQSDESARRFVVLGARAERITVTGGLKFDVQRMSPCAACGTLLTQLQLPDGHPLVIAGSTMKGEEPLVLQAFRTVQETHPDATLLLAPRHPERFDDVTRMSETAGFVTVRRTALPPHGAREADVIVLDTIGELAGAYAHATVAFVGGSLVPTGGHNVLEPAAFGRPVLFGPHMRNFREVASLLLAHDAAVQVPSAAALSQELRALMADDARRARLGTTARQVVDANRGAHDRTLQVLDALLPPVALA